MYIETAVYLEDILKILGWSRAKFFYMAPELRESGAIFYRNEGRPPKERICAFPSVLKAWISKKSSKGESI